MGRRKSGRDVNGVLLLDKSGGLSSNAALQRVRRLFDANKAGHTGSLDPLATGVLPICLGEATKFSQYLLDADKSYRVTARFGIRTDSCDTDGKVLEKSDVEGLTQAEVESAMAAFRGPIEQVPPMVSALKHEGQRLYKLARAGIEVDRKARPVNIYEFKLIEFQSGIEASAVFEVHCSKGTYIRSLVSDLGDALGCGATVAQLRRIGSGQFLEADCISEAQLMEMRGNAEAEILDQYLLPMDQLMRAYKRVELDSHCAGFFMLGQAVMLSETYRFEPEAAIVRVFRDEGTFLGAGEVTADAKVQPKRLRADI